MLSQTTMRLLPYLVLGLTAGLPRIGLCQTSRLATFDHDQETVFALALSADLSRAGGDGAPCDIVVLYDSSASQLGAFREDGLRTLAAMLQSLSSADRVQLLAVDVSVAEMTSDWIARTGPGGGSCPGSHSPACTVRDHRFGAGVEGGTTATVRCTARAAHRVYR